jgi:hypothetical protein
MNNKFINLCACGKLKEAQQLLSENSKIDISSKNIAFKHSFINGYLSVAQWLYSLGNIDIHLYNEITYKFRFSCENGHLEIAQWLYSLGSININSENGYAFRFSCKNGHLKVAQWLYSLGCVDIHLYNEEAFRWSCKNGHLEVAQWLSTLYPNYYLETDNNKIINWKIKDNIDVLIDTQNWSELCDKLGITKVDNISDIKIYNEKCLICQDNYDTIIKCGHTMCIKCFITWYRKNKLKCVYCKESFEHKDCSYIKSIYIK